MDWISIRKPAFYTRSIRNLGTLRLKLVCHKKNSWGPCLTNARRTYKERTQRPHGWKFITAFSKRERFQCAKSNGALVRWAMLGTDAIIDLSHWNTVYDFMAVKASGVQAIIHKASQGLTADPQYAVRTGNFPDPMFTGFWGAYHFGVQGIDPVEQADLFLGIAAGRKVLALDWEWNNADTMTADQAAAFVNRIEEKTGRWPMLYTSAAFLDSIPSFIGPVLLNCDLWLTGFTNNPRIPWGWATKGFRIWQHGIASCPGIQGQVDRDTFNGTPEELAAYFSC